MWKQAGGKDSHLRSSLALSNHADISRVVPSLFFCLFLVTTNCKVKRPVSDFPF